MTHPAIVPDPRPGVYAGLDPVGPGLVPVREWRPGSEFEARARSALWGGVARKP
jgi:hypothetical protein